MYFELGVRPFLQSLKSLSSLKMNTVNST